jgi:chorismate-pyruvate lyase
MLGLYGTLISGDAVLARPNSLSPDTHLSAAEVEDLIESLHARLLASPTATAALEAWCADHKLATVPAIRARIVPDVVKPISQEQRERLQIGASEIVKYRRVELICGDHVLSEADNWYVPARLTMAMNHVVETTDTPFGRAVAGLEPYRKTFSVTRLWQVSAPEPVDGSDPAGKDTFETPVALHEIPARLLELRALVFTKDNVPFAEVCETYTSNVLGFVAP